MLTRSIPFEIKQSHPAYTLEQNVQETQATLAMEGMKLSEDEVQIWMTMTEASWRI